MPASCAEGGDGTGQGSEQNSAQNWRQGTGQVAREVESSKEERCKRSPRAERGHRTMAACRNSCSVNCDRRNDLLESIL